MKIGTLVNFIPPHNKPIPLIQGLIVGIVEKPNSEDVLWYEVQWLSGIQDHDYSFSEMLPCQLEVAK